MLSDVNYLPSMSGFVSVIIFNKIRLFMSVVVCVPPINNLQGLHVDNLQWFHLDSSDLPQLCQAQQIDPRHALYYWSVFVPRLFPLICERLPLEHLEYAA